MNEREAPVLKSFTSSSKDDRCLEVWFANEVTEDTRAWLLEAINEKALRGVAQGVGHCGDLPAIPDDDADFTPDLARKIIAKYQQLLASPAQSLRKLGWLETFTDRGDGSKDQDGWEADSGFGSWYTIEQYFGSDSLGWQVKFEYDVIADHDDPDKAKESAQADFERRVLALPSTGGGTAA